VIGVSATLHVTTLSVAELYLGQPIVKLDLRAIAGKEAKKNNRVQRIGIPRAPAPEPPSAFFKTSRTNLSSGANLSPARGSDLFRKRIFVDGERPPKMRTFERAETRRDTVSWGREPTNARKCRGFLWRRKKAEISKTGWWRRQSARTRLLPEIPCYKGKKQGNLPKWRFSQQTIERLYFRKLMIKNEIPYPVKQGNSYPELGCNSLEQGGLRRSSSVRTVLYAQ
jgi:hypothetical protein